MDRSRILVTGAGGAIGRLICPSLQANGYRIRSFDKVHVEYVEDRVCGELEDLTSLRQAARGIDTIIHLAACSDDADFLSQLVPSNVIGLHNVFEAARLEGVPRFNLASSCLTVDHTQFDEVTTVNDRLPVDHYGLTKLWAEDMGRLYSHRYGISVLATRLGWVVRNQAEFDEMKSTPGGTDLYLSHQDVRRFFLCALQADFAPFAVAYAFSKQTPELFDMTTTKSLLNYMPSDDFPNGLDASFKIITE